MTTSKLASVKRGKMNPALRYMFYGVEGIGKSSLAAAAPEPIYLDLEDGTSLIECARYPFRDEQGGHVAESYPEVLEALDDLRDSDHEFKTVVIDTVDRLEGMVWDFMYERDSVTGIESYGYGKGYVYAVDEWRRLCHKLDKLRTTRGMNIVLLGHAHIKTFKNPEGDDYDRYTLRVNEKSAGFLREWVDVLGFCAFEGGAKKAKDESRARGYSTGTRLIHFERTAAYDAKARIPLPSKMKLARDSPWTPIGVAAEIGGAGPKRLIPLIEAELKRIGDPELTTKVQAGVEENKHDTPTLVRYLTKLKKQEPSKP